MPLQEEWSTHTGMCRLPQILEKQGNCSGGAVDEGDSINTNNGRIQIRFTDGGFVALQPETIYRLDEYEFSRRNRRK